MQEEKAIERYLCRKIKERRGMCVKMVGYNGVPDRLIIDSHGHCYFCEIKCVDGKLSPIQIAVHMKLRQMMHQVYILWSFEDVDIFMSEVYDANNKRFA